MTDSTGWLHDYVEGHARDADFVAEHMALRLVEEAIGMMEEEGISRSDLATLMGVTKPYVSRIFSAPPNLTLRSIAQLAIALGSTPHVSLRPRCPVLEPAAVAWVEPRGQDLGGMSRIAPESAAQGAASWFLRPASASATS